MIHSECSSAPAPRIAVAVLAAGHGTRMKSATPKHVHHVGGVPIVERIIRAGLGVNPSRLIVVVSPQMADMPDRLNMTGLFETVIQPEPRGTADAVRIALDALDQADYLVSLLGDNPLLTTNIIERLIRAAMDDDALLTVLTCVVNDAATYGRIDRNAAGQPIAIVEYKNDRPELRQGATEINSGILVMKADWARCALHALPQDPETGEFLLTDLIAMAVAQHQAGAPWPVSTVIAPETVSLGVNNRMQQAEADAIVRQQIRERHMLAGVTMLAPETVLIDETVTIGQDTVLLPGTILLGTTSIGSSCRIGPNTVVENATIGDRVTIRSSTLEDCVMESDSDCGPYAHLRKGTIIRSHAHVGNFAEMKNTDFGAHSAAGHVSYLGDAIIGERVNIGAGAITANYNGQTKNTTRLADHVFVGSNTVLVAPVTIATGGRTGAGAVVRRDVAEGETVVGVPARPITKRAPANAEDEG